MSKKCKYTIIGLLLALITMITLGIGWLFVRQGAFKANISLNGNKNIILELNEEYLEEGAKARYHFKDVSDSILIKGEVDTQVIGEYIITYQFDEQTKERKVQVVDQTAPIITLIGNETLQLFANEEYEDPGVEVSDNSQASMEDMLIIDNQVKIDQVGVYDIHYIAKDMSGNQSTLTRHVVVNENPEKFELHYQYDHYDNTAFEWWFNKSKDNQRMPAAIDESILAKYQSFYLGPDEKVIYLSYDEGGNDITYIHEIADVLNQYQIPATFFLTRNYILDNEEFMQDLTRNNHLIGNHTRHHYDMPEYANEAGIKKFVSEVLETEKAIWQVTGQKPEKVFRFPKGGTSERSMKIMADLGYRTYFWSHAYYDFAGDVSKQVAYDTMLKHLHNGAIYLLHPSNKGNYLALEDFIKEATNQGYRFGLVDEIK